MMILLNINHYHLNVSVAVVHPGVRDTDVIVHPLDAAVQVDVSAVVLQLVHLPKESSICGQFFF